MAGKKVVANGDDGAAFFSPGTFARHDEAADYVLGTLQTDPPRGNRSRFPGRAPGAWGLLRSGDTITAASGTTLGLGDVDLCESDGTAYDPVVTVEAKNAGAAITASGGDRLLPLEWVLGDWSVCGAGGCRITICVLECDETAYVGATVTIKDGSDVIAEGTTGEDGCISFNDVAEGTYTVEVVASGYNPYSDSHSLSCDTPLTISPSVDNPDGCCKPCGCASNLPFILHLTDANGSASARYSWGDPEFPCFGGAIYQFCVEYPSPNPTWQDGEPLCEDVDGTGTGAAIYFLTCNGDGSWTIVRQWSVGSRDELDPPLQAYDQSHCDGAIAISDVACGTGGVGSASATFTVTDCANFSWSGSLTPSPDLGPLGDPVGGTVTLSA